MLRGGSKSKSRLCCCDVTQQQLADCCFHRDFPVSLPPAHTMQGDGNELRKLCSLGQFRVHFAACKARCRRQAPGVADVTMQRTVRLKQCIIQHACQLSMHKGLRMCQRGHSSVMQHSALRMKNFLA